MKNIFDFKPFKNEDNDTIDFERRFVIPISLAGATFSLASILTNGILNLDKIVQLTPYVSFGVYIAIFIWVWNKKNVTFAKFFIIVFTLILINFLWYYNYGANGPILYLFVLIYSYLIFMIKGKQLMFFTLLIALNLIVLFYIEYNHPDIVGDYSTHHQQVIDVYMSMLFYGLIVFIMMYVAKISYVNAYMEAKKADKLKTSFLENMSHEVRTPLNAIVGFSNFLAEEELDKTERKEYVELINESNDSLLRLVNDILDVSLIESNQIILAEDDVNINDMLTNLWKAYQLIVGKKGSKLEVVVELPKDQYHILGDKIRYRQVFTNLLDNALKFTETGTITLGVKEKEESLVFYVKDTGIGIDKKYHDRLFDRFYKVEEKKDVLFRGTGIGLYLCKKVVELMNGKLWVESEPEKGSLFQFEIPKKGFRKVILANKIIKATYKAHLNRKLYILIAEDNVASQVYYKKILSDLNADILMAGNGKEAVELFQQNRNIDLILMDIKMPVMDGMKALQEIRKINHEIPVVAQTAFAMEKDRERCLKAGFNGFIIKPVSKESLLKILQETGLID